MDLAQKKLAMFDALLSGGGLQRLVDTAAGVLGNPLFITDRGLSMIALSSELAHDPFWSREADEPLSNDIRQASLAGDFRRVYSDDKAVVGDYPGAEQRYLAARVRRGNHLIGHTVVLERNKIFDSEDEGLLPDICRVFGYEIAAGRDVDQLHERYGNLFIDILDGRVTSVEDASMRVRRARLTIPQRMIALLVRIVGESDQISPSYLRGQILATLPGSMAVLRGDDVLVVVDASLREYASMLRARIDLDSLTIGVSYPFDSLVGLRAAYEQAEAAVRFSGNEGVGEKVTQYQDVVGLHLLECASAGHDVSMFDHPALEALARLDESQGTDHLRDLEEYLFHGRNATATARSLHVHKNTMYYRLQRIQEIAGVDLADETTCFALQLGIAMHKSLNER